jgi:diguanylate cyclase
MISAASSLQAPGSDAIASAEDLPALVLTRRLGQRRQMLAIQAVSCALVSLTLLVYVHAGTISIVLAGSYFLSGISLIGFFVVLSESQINNRFQDHHLTLFQVAAHVALQLGFVLAAPELGFAFLSILFLIFEFGALRMTSRQAIVAWTATAMALIPIFLFTRIPIGMPVGTDTERLAASLWFVLGIGQCAFLGLYGSLLRKMLYDRSFELKAANKRIEELAELDELTGSYNSRCIMRMLEDELSRSCRINTPCSIALIDLDLFKRINDAYGHPMGDEVLRTFAITLFANIRGIDRFGRYGGEEFLLVLPDTPNEGAERILNRLRAIVADLDWSALSPDLKVTISAGVATLAAHEKADTFLARADSALYLAKARGRNRIVSARS